MFSRNENPFERQAKTFAAFQRPLLISLLAFSALTYRCLEALMNSKEELVQLPPGSPSPREDVLRKLHTNKADVTTRQAPLLLCQNWA